jgi:succinoglycan biosynthesis transport protein ExoP
MKNSITPAPLWQQAPPPQPQLAPQGLTRNDILFALFRHKKMIVICALGGFAAAAGLTFFYPPLYESRAKLLVRYVLDRSAVDSIDGSTNSNSTASATVTDSIIGSEVEILTSWDLAAQVAQAVGPNRLLRHPSVPPSNEAAARTIALGLEVAASRGSNIIVVTYRNRDPELTPLVLNELLNRYFVKHLEVHRSAGAFDFVTQQTDQVRMRLNRTEDALKALKGKIGILSLADGMTNLSAELARTEEQLHAAEADLAEQRARVKQMNLSVSETNSARQRNGALVSVAQESSASTDAAPTAMPNVMPVRQDPSREKVQQYQELVTRLAQLRQSKLDLLAKYTPKNVRVQLTETQIADLEDARQLLEKEFPDLPSRTHGNEPSSVQQLDGPSESARLAGIEAKTQALRARYREVQAQIKQLGEVGPEIGDLERKKELEETSYKYFENTLEKARVDEALDPSKIPNISAVQRPSPPEMVTTKRNKLLLGLASGGVALGVALALLRELVLSHTIKRPSQLEAQLHTPLLLAIPDASSNGHPRLSPGGGSGSSSLVRREPLRGNLAPWDDGHFIRQYCEAIRDRIGLYFELNQLTHKPKLVGVTSFTKGAGTSTLAAGLAAALSETDDGKVLLVDVNLGPGEVHPFFKGKPAYSLMAALQPASPMDAAADNLYLASVGTPQAGPAQLGLKRFFDLMPNLKASDFDYIIFDMPPLTQTSQTWGMASFMDKLLLVVESERSNREVVKRGYAKLMAERNNISVVLNKTRSYIPKALDGEI